ncbi:MAG TPA: protein translocase subunit SecD [Actinomycetota bacterium]|nr:protein translocase subunit SecD [Actinomycetota bacterium]
MKGTGKNVGSVVFVLLLVGAAVSGFVFMNLKPLLGLDLVGGVSVTLTAPEGTASDVIDKTLEVIRNRVDAFGVGEPDITRQGELNVQVQIPEFEDVGQGAQQQRLLDLIGKTARLEYRLVREVIDPGNPAYEETKVTPDDPEDKVVVFLGKEGETPVKYRLGKVLMTGDVLTRAQAAFLDPVSAGAGSTGGWRITFELNAQGTERFAQITQKNQQKQLAIVLDRRVESAPTIQSEIPDGKGEITGDFTEREAKDLALVLRTGALPVELSPSEVRTVSPTLGKESLRQGLVAGIAGLIGLCLYLAFYYRLLGVVTWLGMAIWSVLALALVSVLGRTAGYSLTLAGVAGIVISLGITADSYIVFYERLKDEVRHGKTLRAAVVPAFRRAWRTIVAADVVTIVAAVVLYLLAIGSVKGFALTLGLSTLLDMFVVYFFKRPTVFLIAQSTRLSEMKGMGLLSGVAATPSLEPVRGGSR